MLQFSYTQSGGAHVHFTFDQISNPTNVQVNSYEGYTQVVITNFSGSIPAPSPRLTGTTRLVPG